MSKEKTIFFPPPNDPKIELDVKKLVADSMREDIKNSLEEFLKDPVFIATIDQLIQSKNKDEIISIISARFSEGYQRGLMKCYDLLKQYDRQQVYDAIDQFDEDEFYKRVLKSCLMK